MKRALIIIFLLAVIAGIVFAVWKYQRKKRDEFDRAHLNGMTRKEFLQDLTSKFEIKFKKETDDWIRKNTVYMTAIEAEADKNGTSVETEIASRVQGAWDKHPAPTTIDWALNYWLPQTIGAMDIDINDSLVQTLIRKV